MKAIYTILAMLLMSPFGFSQEETDPDTTRMKVGNTTILIIEKGEVSIGNDSDSTDFGDNDSGEDDYGRKSKRSSPHWAGIDIGVLMMMDENFDNSFASTPYWDNDIAKSHVINLNAYEHKFNFGTPFIGLTTGLGFNFTSIAFKDNYLISEGSDSLIGAIDTLNSYSKNKLKAAYLTVPLLLEINTSRYNHKNFYLAAGVVGGVRLTSKLKRKGDFEGKEFKQKLKGTYGLNPFKLDAAVRLGFGDFGVFANYSLLPLFDTKKTVEVYPLTFGLSMNF